MLKKKGLLSLVLALGIILSASLPISVFAASSFTDVPSSHTYYSAIMNLTTEGIINGYPDGTFNPEGPVTRAEFTKIICYATDVGELTYGESARAVFTDVPTNHWAINNIITAKNAGIINGMGDGTFNPDGQVLYEQAVKMAACAIGYTNEERIEREGGFPKAYLGFAESRGLIKYVGGTSGVPLTRGKVAQLIDNMRNAKQINAETGEEKESLREETVTRSSVEGRIVAVKGTTLFHDEVSTTQCGKKQIEIELSDGTREFYGVENFAIENVYEYLGRTATLYYDIDVATGDGDVYNIVLKANRNATTNVGISDIENYSATSVEYTDDNKDNEIDTASDIVVIHNGLSVDKTLVEMIDEAKLADYATFVFVCTKSNDVADVVFVKTYETYHVTSKNTSTHQVYWSGGNITLDETDKTKTITFIKDGKPSNFAGVSNNITSIAVSDNGKIIEVQISTKTTKGTIEEVTNNNIKLSNNAKSYKYAPGCPEKALVAGDFARLYLDAFGNIAKYELTVEQTATYGYLADLYKEGSSTNAEISVYLYKPSTTSQTARGQEYLLADRVKIDGTSYEVAKESSNILLKLSDAAAAMNPVFDDENPPTGTTYAQPIRFTTNDAGEINSILTNRKTGSNHATTLNIDSFMTEGTAIECTTAKTALGRYSIGTSPVIIIPANRTGGTYKTSNNSIFTKETRYYLQFANVSGSNVPAAIYVYGTTTGGDMTAEALTEDNAPMIVRSKTNARNPKDPDSSVTTKLVLVDVNGVEEDLEGYYSSDYEGTSAATSVAAGDVVRAVVNEKGYITAFEVVADASDIVSGTEEGFVVTKGTITDRNAKYRVIVGHVRDVNGSSLVMVPKVSISDYDASLEETHTNGGSTKVYIVDTAADDVVTDAVYGDVIGYEQQSTNASKVLVYTSSNAVKAIIIFK